MPASASPQGLSTPSPQTGHDVVAQHVLEHRVVSVSPHSIESERPPQPLEVENRTASVLHHAASTLRTAIDEARGLIREMAAHATAARSSRADAEQSVTQLQERLRLSAQMLKAFQSQISRIDQLLVRASASEKRVEAAESRMQQQADAINAHVAHAIERLNSRVEELTTAAMEKIDLRVDERAADAAARWSNANAATAESFKSEFGQLAATMRAMADRIGHLGCIDAADVDTITQSESAMSRNSAQVVTETKPQSGGEVHITPPLRFHSWSAQG